MTDLLIPGSPQENQTSLLHILTQALVSQGKISEHELTKKPHTLAFIAQCASILLADQGIQSDAMDITLLKVNEALGMIDLNREALMNIDDTMLDAHPSALCFYDDAFAPLAALILKCGVTPIQILSVNCSDSSQTHDWIAHFLPLASVLIEAGKMTFDEFCLFATCDYKAIELHLLEGTVSNKAFVLPEILQQARSYLATLKKAGVSRNTSVKPNTPLPYCLLFRLIAHDIISVTGLTTLINGSLYLSTIHDLLYHPQTQHLLQLNILTHEHLAQDGFTDTHDALLHLTHEQIHNLFVVQRLTYDHVSDQTHNQLLAMSMLDHRPEMRSAVITLPLSEDPNESDQLATLIDAHPFISLSIRSIKSPNKDSFAAYITHKALDWITRRIAVLDRLQSLYFLMPPSIVEPVALRLLIDKTHIPAAVKRFIAGLSDALHLTRFTPPDMLFCDAKPPSGIKDCTADWEGRTLVLNPSGEPAHYLLTDSEDSEAISEIPALLDSIERNIAIMPQIATRSPKYTDFWNSIVQRNTYIHDSISQCIEHSQRLLQSVMALNAPGEERPSSTPCYTFNKHLEALASILITLPEGNGKDILNAFIAWFTFLQTQTAIDFNKAAEKFDVPFCIPPMWQKVRLNYDALNTHFFTQGKQHALASKTSQPDASEDSSLDANTLLALAYFACLPDCFELTSFKIQWSVASINAAKNALPEKSFDAWTDKHQIDSFEPEQSVNLFNALNNAILDTQQKWQHHFPESLEAFATDIAPNSLLHTNHSIAFSALTLLRQIADAGIKKGLALKTMFAPICEEPWFDDWLTHYQALDTAPRAYPSAAGRSPAHFQPVQTDDSEEPYHSPQNVTSSGKP